jgi:seryl-tRNA(Sec) selenium transferase
VLLTLNTPAQGNDAIVSRGGLIEIRGPFGLPGITARAGAKLAEVGKYRSILFTYQNKINASYLCIE